MIVVSDTSPLNYLLLVNQIDLLPRLYGKVIIPNAVYAELLSPGAPQVVTEWVLSLPGWVEVHTASTLDLTLHLGAGESEAITLALALKADVLLMDERKGRREAVARGLAVTGTLNILDAAAERGMIDLQEIISRLMQTSFRAAPDSRDIKARIWTRLTESEETESGKHASFPAYLLLWLTFAEAGYYHRSYSKQLGRRELAPG
jgi:predicted nucleic acid-binding protein